MPGASGSASASKKLRGRHAPDQLRGLARVDWAFTFAAAAYYLVRARKLLSNA
jgi:hypothetical protein